MRVGILHNAYRYRGGEDRVVEAETDLLREAGLVVSPLILDNRVAFASLGPRLKNTVRAASGWNTSAASDVAAWARRERLDVVHAHNLYPLITPAALEGLHALRVPVVQTLHSFRMLCANGTMTRGGTGCDDCVRGNGSSAVRYGCYRGSRVQSASWLAGRVAAGAHGTWDRAVNRYIAPSEHVRDAHVAGGVNAERVVVRPHFTDMPSTAATGYDGALVIGRVEEAKGVGDLVRHWPGDAPVLTVAGDGPEAGAIRAAAGENVRFTGVLDRATLRTEIARAGVVVSASRLPETFGLTMVEAFACATPAVAFAVGGCRTIIEHGVTGLLADSLDVSSLVELTVGLLDDPERLREMGTRAAECHARLYSPEAGLRSLLAIYSEVLSPSTRVAA